MSKDSTVENSKPGKQSIVSLREVTADTVRQICRLKVGEAQNKLVAPNALSFAEAYYEPKAWIRAIYADETPVGFVMVYLDPEKPKYFLWRFMVDERYQKLGFGRQAMERLIEHALGQPGVTLFYLSCEPIEIEGSPEPFYARFGFERTGRLLDDEVEMKLDLFPNKE